MSLAAAIAIDRPRVNVVGSISIDLLVRLARLPAPGETVPGGQYEEIPEGEGANQPVAASRLRADVALIARIGDDEYGDEALRDLAESGIDTRPISISRGQRTGVAAILVDAQGENVIGVAPGGNARLTAGDVCRALAAVRDDYAVVVACLETPLSAVQAAATDEMPNAARIANVAAASSTEGHCGRSALPAAEAVLDFLEPPTEPMATQRGTLHRRSYPTRKRLPSAGEHPP